VVVADEEVAGEAVGAGGVDGGLCPDFDHLVRAVSSTGVDADERW
jgi:hypothetical protein